VVSQVGSWVETHFDISTFVEVPNPLLEILNLPTKKLSKNQNIFVICNYKEKLATNIDTYFTDKNIYL